MAKESLFKVPIVGWVIKHFGTIPVSRNGTDTTAIRKSIEVIKDGGCFSIFPQGTRMHVTPQPEQAKKGVGLICNKAEAGVLPIGIYTKNYKIMPFRKIKVKIGEFIPFSKLDFGEGRPDYDAVARQIFTDICTLVIPEENK